VKKQVKMKTCLIIICTIISSASAFSSWSLYPGTRLVTTRKGVVRGIQINFKDRNLAPVEAFLGIPYASPPVGTLRFMPPVTAPPWRNVRTADKLGPACPQQFPDISNKTAALSRMPKGRLETLKKMQPLLRHQSEDCLHLNIYTPFEGKIYPVGRNMFWIKGNSRRSIILIKSFRQSID
jgi:neuroligin